MTRRQPALPARARLLRLLLALAPVAAVLAVLARDGAALFAAGTIAGATMIIAALATASGVSAGLLLAPTAMILARSGLLVMETGQIVALALAATAAAALAAALSRRLKHMESSPGDTGFPAAAVWLTVSATGVPVALLAAIAVDLEDLPHMATVLILGLVLSTGVLALAVVAQRAGWDDRPRPIRRDWWMLLGAGAAGGYLTAHVPFGIAELVLIYLLFRGVPPRQSQAIASAAPLLAAAAAGFALWRDLAIDPALILAIVPAAFCGSMIGAELARPAGALRVTIALAGGVMFVYLGLIALALR